jgi:hypothetical protein
MGDSQRVDENGAGDVITCMDDVPDVARRAAQQQFLKKWYRPLALGPFAVLVFLVFGFFPQSDSRILLALIFLSLFWAIAVAGYTFYLLVAVRCPACKNRFGSGKNCRSCNLPRHSDSSKLFGANSR